ncbi:hypothetical protein WJX81_003551 [Elliptochloris bilobata]|uniref:Cytosol aminopeptidase domain-containing protein n=1 Tax=Elliptochloris bilobata TaxID=381761 RepID=A0AAW1SBQ7_9CHLO
MLQSVRPIASSLRSALALQCVAGRGVVVASMSSPVSRDDKRVDLSKEVALYPEAVAAVTASDASVLAWKGDLLALGVFEEAITPGKGGEKGTIKSPELAELDKSLGGLLTELVELNKFTGKAGSSAFARLGGSARVAGLVGMGKLEKAKPVAEWGPSAFQALGAAVATAAKAHHAKTAAVAVVDAASLPSDGMAEAAGKVAAGALTGAYEATRFANKPPDARLESLAVLGAGAGAEAAIKRAAALARGNILARYIVEAPPNICTPSHLARAAEAIAAAAPDVFSCRVLEQGDCEEMRMGCYLGVTACSAEPPKFIHMIYKPAGEVKRRVALVGKGLTFDSGGYNLKVGGMIEMMKFDCGGAAAVLGAAEALAGIRPRGVEVHIISAACENMIDGKGMRPGDILQAANGKTVEVNNTDAEGRLTLADALWYAQEKCGAEAVVDIATLTGACMVALGNQVAGFWTSSEEMATALTQASRCAGEKVWRMPLEESYWEQMKSPIADMKNTGGRTGGAITAALFLRQFVDTDKVEHAHVDIAGPAWDDKAGGATGMGATTLAEWAAAQGA